MMNWKITVSHEDAVYVAEVTNRGNKPYYAQGMSYGEALSNLFGVIEESRQISGTRVTASNQKVSFEVPVLS
jgi:hypothetical protein